VALVRPNNATGVGLSDALVSTLRFAGGTVAENQTHFAEYVLDGDTAAARIAEATRALSVQRPSIIIYCGSEYLARVFAPLERAWPTGAPKPVYVSALPLDGFGAIEGDPAWQKRVLGISPPSNTAVNTKFVLHYNAAYDDKIDPGFAPNTTYDAFYVLAYAAYAAGEKPVTGNLLASSLGRLASGKSIEVGPAHALEALVELGAGRNIDLEGAGSHLDLDPATGDDAMDHTIQCVGRDAEKKLVGVESGLVYDARSGKMRGALTCH
jgi:hypothetical protein